MMTLHRTFIALLTAVAAACPVVAATADDDDEALRVNPDLAPAVEVTTDYANYPWLNIKANRVALNGADWSAVAHKMAAIATRPLRIVVVGDSHIQADGATSVVRRALHQRYGSAGRGMVTPLRLAGTNEPRDYRLTSTTPRWLTSRLVPRRAERPMMFTGVAVTPSDTLFNLTVGSTESSFTRLRLYCGGSTPGVLAVTSASGIDLPFTLLPTDDAAGGVVDIALSAPASTATLSLAASSAPNIGGVELLDDRRPGGVEFSSIGNNGAAYLSYLGIGLGRGLAAMCADIVIISLGTNDAWGSMTDADFIASVDRLVGEVRHDCPEAKILLTTPCEAQKAQRRSRGRGRRTHTVYAPNRKVGRFSTLLVNYGRDNGIAVYDFYSVAGGDLSSSRWLRAGLFSRDRIHLSWPGYSLMGRLTADALITCLESLKQTNPDNATGNQ